jgi:hypothetical protein
MAGLRVLNMVAMQPSKDNSTLAAEDVNNGVAVCGL